MNRSRVLLLIPFDAGQSFLFSAGAGTPIRQQWDAVFTGKEGWSTDQFPANYVKPLGWISRLTPDPATVRDVLDRNVWIDPGTAELQFIFFTIGIGVFALRADLAGDPIQAIQRFRADRDSIRRWFAPVLNSGAAAFREVFGKASELQKSRRAIYKLPYVDTGRDNEIRDARYPYPLYFISEQAQYDQLRTADLNHAGRDPREADHGYSHDGNTARLHVGWAEGYANGDWPALREAIEDNFLIALASWYSLVLMNRMVSRYLIRTFAELAQRQHHSRKEESRAIRLTYMDTASASHPIRWTTRQRDLLLLERIHQVWSSDKLWKNVEERTELLSVHHDQLEAEANERRNRWFTGFGIVIACLTLASAAADVLSLIPDRSSASWLKAYGVHVSIALPLALLAGLAIFIFRKDK